MGAQSAPTRDEFAASLLSAAFVAGQCSLEVSFGAGERIGKRLGILCRLGDGGADVRPGNKGSVTHERNTAKRQTRHFEIKNSREDRPTGADGQRRELTNQKGTSRTP